MKKVLLILIYILFVHICMMADSVDFNSNLPSIQDTDSVVIEKFNDIAIDNQTKDFGLSVVASLVAAVIALILFFKFLRPRVIVVPIVAIIKEKNKPLQFQILLKNKGIFEVNDIRIHLEGVFDLINGDIQTKSLIKEPVQILTLKGIFNNSNLNEECYTFSLPSLTEKMPSQIIVSLLSQHSLSSVVVGKKYILGVDKYKKGKFAKGLFIPKGLTYKQELFRLSLNKIKWVVLSLFIVLLLEIFILFVLQLVTTEISLIIIIGSILIILLLLILWQQYIYAKGNAYNSGYIHQHLQIIMASFDLKETSKKELLNDNLEDVFYEEVENEGVKQLK